MERIHKLLQHPEYIKVQNRLDELEKERIYCRHGIDHCVEVARIMYIHTLEDNLPYKKAVVYATALLHDLGRVQQYETGQSHEEAGVQFACGILSSCGFDDKEIADITLAIAGHRDNNQENGLAKLLYKADKRSRACFACKAADTCKWSVEKRNTVTKYVLESRETEC